MRFVDDYFHNELLSILSISCYSSSIHPPGSILCRATIACNNSCKSSGIWILIFLPIFLCEIAQASSLWMEIGSKQQFSVLSNILIQIQGFDLALAIWICSGSLFWTRLLRCFVFPALQYYGLFWVDSQYINQIKSNLASTTLQHYKMWKSSRAWILMPYANLENSDACSTVMQ